MIFDLLEIVLLPFLSIKVHIWNLSLNMILKKKTKQNLNSKSQNLVINPDQGPALKCAPGHESIKDSSIIKSYRLKIRVMDIQHIIF